MPGFQPKNCKPEVGYGVVRIMNGSMFNLVLKGLASSSSKKTDLVGDYQIKGFQGQGSLRALLSIARSSPFNCCVGVLVDYLPW